MNSTEHDSSSGKDEATTKQEVDLTEIREAGQDAFSGNTVADGSKVSMEEWKLVRKLDRRILPIICLMYLFAFLDRSNVGNARLQGLPEDALHGDPTGKLYDWVFSAFFFSYVMCQVPAVIASKLFPPRLWLGTAALGWGICSTLMSTGYNFAGLFVARIGLGVFEACFGPGMPLYLSYFYTRHELGLRLAYFQTFGAVAGAFSGLVAFGIQHAHASVANWRLLFIVEGVPSVLMGLITLTFLPDRPEMTRFFNEKERKIALERVNRAISSDIGYKVKKSHIWAALKDWRVYVGGVIFFGLNCGFASISAFLPTIIKSFGFTNAIAQLLTVYVGGVIFFGLNCGFASISAFLPTIIKSFGFTNAIAQLLTVPPYAVAAILLMLTSYISDRIQNRGLPMAIANAVGAIGYLILLLVPTNVHARYFAVFCITAGIFAAIGLIIAWYAHNLGSETKRATGIPLFMAIGQCGSVLGSHIFPSTEGPRYIRGFSVTCGLQFIGAICAFILSISYIMDNRRRDHLYGKPVPEATVDTSELADKALMFRYVP
ncbi:MFS general substrate transporter [Sanghuangporus baumii]|uniref:MFS general substrate transporter n=1 Tax=Sanghuangporus baumii TaxID=108892 RepID=A0A9Q5I531_SANBA|nr:MFS general substrate transporter [Sanghuangporus baumii]